MKYLMVVSAILLLPIITFGDCLEKPFQNMVAELVSGIDSGRVIVRNLQNINGGETRLGVYLATRMSNYLFGCAQKNKRISVRDRQWGLRLTREELAFSEPIPSDDFRKRMGADIVIVGRYALKDNTLEIIELEAITTPGSTIKSKAKSLPLLIKMTPDEYKRFKEYEDEPLPTSITQEELFFLCEPGGHKGLISKIELLDRDKNPYQRDSVKVGEYLKLRIRLDTVPLYLYVFGWQHGKDPKGAEDIITLIYPNNYDPQNPVTRTFLTIPADDSIAIKASAPPGYNWIRVIASVKPVDMTMMPEFGPKDPILRGFNDALRKLDYNSWQGKNLDIWIVGAE
ncbi:MAG: DUF4384 domain-containing protein [bacterium]